MRWVTSHDAVSARVVHGCTAIAAMLTLVTDAEVAASAPLVFDVMADLRNEVLWNSQVCRAELVSVGSIGEGTRFTSVTRGGQYETIITQYRPSETLALHIKGAALDVVVRFRFEPLGAARTRLRACFSLQLRGLLRLMAPVVQSRLQQDLPKQLRRFGRLCERVEAAVARDDDRQRLQM